jgi:hypothetical protein
MQVCTEFSLDVPTNPDEIWSGLLYNGKTTGTMVEGRRIEGQFSVGDRTLLLLTEDCPYEEGLRLALLDSKRRVIDDRTLGVAYSTGLLKDVRRLSQDELGFSFMGRWRLRVLRTPEFMWPHRSDFIFVPLPVPLGVGRFWRRRYLRLVEEPG